MNNHMIKYQNPMINPIIKTTVIPSICDDISIIYKAKTKLLRTMHPYLLGWLYSTKCAISPPMICIRTFQAHVIELLKSCLNHEEIELYEHRNHVRIISSIFCEKVLELLNIQLFDHLCTSEKIDFLRGIFDAENTIIINTNFPKCILITPLVKPIYKFIRQLEIECVKIKEQSTLIFTGTNCIDFLGVLYNNTKIYSPLKYVEYLRLLDVQHQELPKCVAYKVDKSAVIPYKAKQSHISYVLTCIKLSKQVGHIYVYDTGIKINIDHYNYFGQVTFKNTAYLTIGNNIVESDEPISLNLLKIDPNAPDLQVPFTCNLVFRKKTHVEILDAYANSSMKQGTFDECR